MSVMMLSERLYSTVLDNIGRYHNYTYFMPLRMDVEHIIPVLYLLNQRSYTARYKGEPADFQPFKYDDKTADINPCQLLKYLQCIRYQIEDVCATYEEKQAVKFLDGWIDNMTTGLIRSIPEYETAAWAEV